MDLPATYQPEAMNAEPIRSDDGSVMCPVCFGVVDVTGFRKSGGTVVRFDEKLQADTIQRCPRCNES